MKVEKEKHDVVIYCLDGSMIKGYVHINPGERVIDFINDSKENFIAVTKTECQSFQEVKSFRLVGKFKCKKELLLLNKGAIKYIEEIPERGQSNA
jgi:hypothetical protein